MKPARADRTMPRHPCRPGALPGDGDRASRRPRPSPRPVRAAFRRTVWLGLGLLACLGGQAQTVSAEPAGIVYASLTDLPYYPEETLARADDYQRAQCRLDLYLPENRPGFATVIWFHGGNFTRGRRSVPALLKDRGFAVVAVGYRLAPPGRFPCFLEDAAAATAWVLRSIAARGGDPKKVFVSGHSAGGYLAMMLGLDGRWLEAQGASRRQLAGIISISAQMTTHPQIRKLRGDPSPALRPVIDEFAPLHYAAADLPPICLVVGDRALDIPSRAEENALMAAALRNLGHPRVVYREMSGLAHGDVDGGGVNDGGQLIAREFVAAVSAGRPPGETVPPVR